MASLNVNGVVYDYPDPGDENWGTPATNWASAVTSGMLQKAGGTFTLTAEVAFGASFGLKSLYYKSNTANPATAGQIRLGNTDAINWRNAANDGNIGISLDASNIFQFGAPISVSGVTGVLPLANGSASAPSLTFTSDTNLGIYRVSADLLGIASNGRLVSNFTDAAGVAVQQLVPTSGTEWGQLQLSLSDSALYLVADTGSSAGAQVRLHGSTHATLASVGQFTKGATVQGSFDTNGKWTLGPSGSTQAHAINGTLAIATGAADTNTTISGSTTTSIVRLSLTNSTNAKRIQIANDMSGSFPSVAINSQTAGEVFLTLNSTGASGGGNILVGTGENAAASTDGFFYLNSLDGNPVGTPTAYTGQVPCIIVPSTGRLYAYYGAAWHFVALT